MTIDSRSSVTTRLLITIPGGSSKAMLLIFPGGDGTNHFRTSGEQIILGGNFLVRSVPLFRNQGLSTAVIDAPSDRSGGMNGAFRTSINHAQDIQAAIDYLGKQGFGSIYLVGTSAGTLSAGYVPTVIKDTRIKGVILTSSLGSFFASLLGNAPLDKIAVPILMVHHHDDGCEFSKFQDALTLKGRFSKVDFVEVRGGLPPRSIPCEAMSYHGYLGMEEPVVQVITDWIAGKSAPPLIGQ
jgi:dienelactone hydrolase